MITPKFRYALLAVPFLYFSGCQTSLQETWNHTVSRLTPDRTAEREERYGLRSTPSEQPRSRTAGNPSENSEIRKSPVKPTAVVLKPFRKSVPAPKIENRPAKSKPTPSPTPTLKEEPVMTPPDSKPTPEPGPPPFASPVPGKKGYVTSPFSPGAGFIDVTGLDPGSEAKDPYTGKVFRVP